MKSLTQLNTYSAESVAYDDQGTGAQTLANRYQINGLIDPSNTVMSNIEKICSAAGSWLSYDITEGKWGVVINSTGTSTASFDDTNILSNITVSGTGITELYNSTKVEFPHRELRDSADFVTIEIADEDRNANEEDNTLNLSYDIINEPIQAQLLGLIELKQSRIDLVINFQTDYSKISVKAGDIIDVTNNRFGFDAKLFRVISTTEQQDEEGALRIEITALEYDADVYSIADLYRYTRSDANGIITIGSIGVPGTPQITKFENDSRPRIIVESSAPTGVVEALEFWITEDTVETEDSLRSYKLVASIKPPGGGTYTSGSAVILDYDNLAAGDFYIKTRGVNGATTGPFSDISGLIEYVPQQITDAIGPNTSVVDATGALVTALAANYLMNQLSDLITGNLSTGSLLYSIFDGLQELTGVDLISQLSSGTITQAVGIAVKDEGVTLTTSTSVFNFIGDTVEVTNSGSVVTVNVSATNITSIDQLLDVNTATITPTVGDRLIWNGNEWIPDELGAYYKSSGSINYSSGVCVVDGFIAVGSKQIPRVRNIGFDTCGSYQYITSAPTFTSGGGTAAYILSKTGPVSGKYIVKFTSTTVLSTSSDFIIQGVYGPGNESTADNVTATNFIGYHKTISTGTSGSWKTIDLEFNEDPGNIASVYNYRVSYQAFSTSLVQLPTVSAGQLKRLVITNTTGTLYTLAVNADIGHLTYRVDVNQSENSAYGADPLVDSISGKFLPTNSIYYSDSSTDLVLVGDYSSVQTILQGKLGWQYSNPIGSAYATDGITPPDEINITYTLTIDGVTKVHTETLKYQDYKSTFPLDKRFG